MRKNLIVIACSLIAYGKTPAQDIVSLGPIVIHNNFHTSIPANYLDSIMATSLATKMENLLLSKTPSYRLKYHQEDKIQLINASNMNGVDLLTKERQSWSQSYTEGLNSSLHIMISSIDGVSLPKMTLHFSFQIRDGNKLQLKEERQIKVSFEQMSDADPSIVVNDVPAVNSFPISANQFSSLIVLGLDLFGKGDKSFNLNLAEHSHVIDKYDEIKSGARKYRVVAKNNFMQTAGKIKVLGFINLKRERPLELTEIETGKQGSLKMWESMITDINVSAGSNSALGFTRQQRNFRTEIRLGNKVMVANQVRAVGLNPTLPEGTSRGLMRLNVKGDWDADLVLTRKELSEQPLPVYLRKQGRVFHPNGSLAGTLNGKRVAIKSSEASKNTIEIWIDEKLVAIASHPTATSKYLRKGKKLMPFIMYCHHSLPKEFDVLALELFQLNQIGYLMSEYQENRQRKN